MATTTDSVFSADPEGFRETNAGRPAAHLIRELVQNVFDERATRLEVDLAMQDDGLHYSVVDDVVGGIRDEKLIWTIWSSDKQDTPTKRGRMGRGLKELISVSDETLIISEGCPAIAFERGRGGKWSRSRPIKRRPKVGSVVTGRVKLWKEKDRQEIIGYLRRMRPPEGLAFIVNGVPVDRRAADESYTLKLPTVVFVSEDGGRIARERTAEAVVELFREEQPWVYEMGIPVEPIDFPMSIDVGQRVPLREKRDTLTDAFRRELYAKLVDLRVQGGMVTDAELRDNHVLTAAASYWNLSHATRLRIATVWTDGKPYATTPQDVSVATGMHIQPVLLRSLPESVRNITRDVGTNVRDMIAQVQQIACDVIPNDKQTYQQQRLVRTWEWIAEEIGRPCTVQLRTGRPSERASFNREASVLNLFVDNVGEAMVEDCLGARALQTLIHELSHWTSHGDEHGGGFTSDAEAVGGQVAELMYKKNPEITSVFYGV